MTTLRDLIADGGVHVLDGAMGTMLYSRGVFVNVCYDELNVSSPDLVYDVHDAYVRAGAELLETNTFGANPVKLSAFGLADRTEEINRAAVALAHRAARGRASVAGAIGPLGVRIEPWGPTSKDEATALFGRQIDGLVAGGVDGFVLETFGDLDELHAALQAVRQRSDLPVIAQMTVGEDGNTPYGTSVEAVAARLTEWGADVIGLNCSVGPAPMLDAIERMAEATDRPLSAQPNAGLPRAVGDRRIYLASPEYMAQYARRLAQAGVRFIGGCCGTTPDHVRRIREAVAGARSRRPSGGYTTVRSATPPLAEPVPLVQRSRLGRKLAAGEPVTTVQILPPRGWNPSGMLEQCRALKAAGVDAIDLLDTPRAQSRMGVLPAALVVERDVGVETIFHYTCRDRNMLGMLSDLLGAAAGGLRNILVVTGDPPSAAGPYPDATAVFDIDSIGLTNVIRHLNSGLDPGGNAIGEPTQFVIGVAVNQGAADAERELERFAWKVDAGAEFAVTQPVFDPDALARFLERAGRRVPVLAGLWPLTSLRNAEFLANEVPGVTVPQTIIERMRQAESRGAEHAWSEGLQIALEMYEAIQGLVQGVQINASATQIAAGIETVKALRGAAPTAPPLVSP